MQARPLLWVERVWSQACQAYLPGRWSGLECTHAPGRGPGRTCMRALTTQQTARQTVLAIVQTRL